MVKRKVSLARKTKETDVRIDLNLDGRGKYKIKTTVPFMDHMLELFSKHSGIDLSIKAKGDTQIDDHHLVEDIGITLGEALYKALGSKTGICRYGEARIPMDESLSGVYVDLSGRPFFEYKVRFKKSFKEEFDFGLIEEFLRALSFNSKITLHVIAYYGKNNHHIAESVFKAMAQALKTAVAVKGKSVPSTKGSL